MSLWWKAPPVMQAKPTNRMLSALTGIVLLCIGPSISALAGPTSSQTTAILDTLQQDMVVLKNQLYVMFSAMPHLADIGSFVAARITKGYDADHIWRIGLELIAVFAGALFGEAAARRLFHPLHRLLPALDEHSDFGKLGALLVNALVRLFELAAFGLVAIGLFLAVYEGHEAARNAFWCLFFFVVLVRAVGIALRVLLAPQLPELRLPRLDDATARRLYRRLLLIVTLVLGTAFVNTFFYQIDLPEPLYLASSELMLAIATLGILAVIWRERRSIGQLIGVRLVDGGTEPTDLAGLFAGHWHVFVSCFFVAIWIVASVDRLVTGERQAARIFESLCVLVGFLLIDGLMRMTVRSHFGNDAVISPIESYDRDDRFAVAIVEESDSAADQTANAAYGTVILRNARIALAVTAFVLVSRIWKLDFSGIGSGALSARVAEALFQIIITLLLASSAWGIVKIAINRHLPREKLDALALVSEDISGVGLSRLETLLPLVRMFLFVTIVTVAVMSVISALGVNIGPLLAGAGVVGIAVGFGAQTLVRDILSGIFFLFDDAFRVGEYIDVGEGKGTVERMSIRAVMLRHQLGQINTIPFGVIRRITNYSRDWTIMKLEVRVPFDTDLEQLRKVVKKAGADLAADPEYGPMFLQPLKSQGVNRIDDSAFVVRVKFMAKPTGEAFILRRHVFRRLQQAFQQNGIEFASRRVVVEGEDERSAGAADAAIVPLIGDRRSHA